MKDSNLYELKTGLHNEFGEFKSILKDGSVSLPYKLRLHFPSEKNLAESKDSPYTLLSILGPYCVIDDIAITDNNANVYKIHVSGKTEEAPKQDSEIIEDTMVYGKFYIETIPIELPKDMWIEKHRTTPYEVGKTKDGMMVIKIPVLKNCQTIVMKEIDSV